MNFNLRHQCPEAQIRQEHTIQRDPKLLTLWSLYHPHLITCLSSSDRGPRSAGSPAGTSSNIARLSSFIVWQTGITVSSRHLLLNRICKLARHGSVSMPTHIYGWEPSRGLLARAEAQLGRGESQPVQNRSMEPSFLSPLLLTHTPSPLTNLPLLPNSAPLRRPLQGHRTSRVLHWPCA